jgi:hypothetical protein
VSQSLLPFTARRERVCPIPSGLGTRQIPLVQEFESEHGMALAKRGIQPECFRRLADRSTARFSAEVRFRQIEVCLRVARPTMDEFRAAPDQPHDIEKLFCVWIMFGQGLATQSLGPLDATVF